MEIDSSDLKYIDPGSFSPERPTRIDVRTPQCVIPLLVVRRAEARRLVVLCNGAVDLARSGGEPVFQRSSWWSEIQAHQIYVCDPVTVGADALSLGWAQWSLQHWLVPEIARACQHVYRALGVAPDHERLYFGSSAGGFLACGLVGLDPGARAVVNNPQFDWTRWFPPAVNALRNQRLDGLLPSVLRQEHAPRTNVLSFLATQPELPSIEYWVNLMSAHDRDIQLAELDRAVEAHPRLRDSIHVRPYVDGESKHNPLSKDETLSLLNT